MNTEYVKEQIFKLMAIDSPSGYTDNAADYVIGELKRLGYAPKKTVKGGIVVEIGGNGNPLVFSAHIDTLGGMVAEIKDNGRLKLTRVGGLQPQNIEGENCKIKLRFGGEFDGCFMLNDPSVHVNGEYNTSKRDFSSMEVVVDAITTSKKETEALGISVGDFVCFDPRTCITETGYIKSRFLDDKLSVAMLLEFARIVKEESLILSRKVYLFITVYEEVGHGCSTSIPDDVTEIVCVDMGCIGSGLTCTERDVSICVKDGFGPYNFEVTSALIKCAKDNAIAYAADVYPFYGSDADAALSSGFDIKHGLIGAGVYASHGYERSHMDGVVNTIKLITNYVKA
ncbi:MAG: M42 family metallopeptidase [Clostridia bacterium]